jgi:hypothetical protein
MRAEDGIRALCFAGENVRVEVEISGSGPSRTLIGRLVPGVGARVEIRHADHITTVAADSHGRFNAADVPAGTVSLRCHLDTPGGARALATPWLHAMYQDRMARPL